MPARPARPTVAVQRRPATPISIPSLPGSVAAIPKAGRGAARAGGARAAPPDGDRQRRG